MFRPEFIIDNRVNWYCLYRNPNAIPILEQNLNKGGWMASNPNAIYLVSKLDTEKMRQNCQSFAEDLAKYVFYPNRLERMSSYYEMDFDEYVELLN